MDLHTRGDLDKERRDTWDREVALARRTDVGRELGLEAVDELVRAERDAFGHLAEAHTSISGGTTVPGDGFTSPFDAGAVTRTAGEGTSPVSDREAGRAAFASVLECRGRTLRQTAKKGLIAGPIAE
jgi:hypothetical protein